MHQEIFSICFFIFIHLIFWLNKFFCYLPAGQAQEEEEEEENGESGEEAAGEAAGEPAGEPAGEAAGEPAGEPAGAAAGEPAGAAAGEPAEQNPAGVHQDGEDHDVGRAAGQGEKRKRCAACYREAEDRRRAQAVKRVVTSCVRCGKPFCRNHLVLYCGDCSVARLPHGALQLQELAEERERIERERQDFQTAMERQQQEIEDLRQQVRILIPLVSKIFILISHSFLTLLCIRIWS